MVVVVERMTSVALARSRVWEVTQTTGPQQGAARVRPRAVEFRLRNCSQSLVHRFEARDGRARVDGIDLARGHGERSRDCSKSDGLAHRLLLSVTSRAGTGAQTVRSQWLRCCVPQASTVQA